MQVVRKTVTSYKCDVCKTSYTNRKEAMRCEAKPVEKKLFEIGDRVVCRVVHVCNCQGFQKFKFKPVGKIVRVLKPEPMDGEDNKWVQRPDALEIHAYQYEIKFRCPKCRGKRGYVAYTPELTPLNNPATKVLRKLFKIYS